MRLQFRLHTPKDYVEFLEKRKWWIVVPLLLIGTCGTFIIYKLPDVYSSSTVVLVEAQKIDPSFVRNPVSISVKDRLNTIRNKICSSTNLEKIVAKFKLFQDQSVSLTEQGKTELLRRRIEIFVDRPSSVDLGQVSYFSISYQDKSPYLAQAVTSEVASQFLTEEEKQSKEKIVKTSGFIDNQITEMLDQLEKKKRELSQVRLQNMVNMPLDASTYAKQLESLEGEVNSTREAVDRWQDKLMGLERDLSNTPQTVTRQIQVADDSETGTTVENSQPETSVSSSVDTSAIQAEIDRLRKVYTDEHPDVRKLTKQLERIKAQQEEELKKANKSSPTAASTVKEPALKNVTSPNPVYRRLTSQINQVKRTLESQQTRLNGMEKQKVALQERLSRWPQITQTVADKTAEMNNLEIQYNALKTKQQEAKLSVELVNRAQTEQFRIQDPANLPEKPIKPDRPRLYLMSWIIALGAGVFFSLARDLTDQAIRSPSDIALISSLPVLASVPPIYTPAEKAQAEKKARYLTGLYAISGASVVVLLLIVAMNDNLVKRIMDYIDVFFT